MKNLAIARRYAKALLLIGKQDGKADTYRDELNRVTELVGARSDLAQVLNNPLYDATGRKSVLHTVVGKLELSETVTAFLMLLFDKGRFGFLAYVNEFYQKFADEFKGIARASLVSATALPAETVEKIRTTLSQKTGKDIILEVKEDPGLIGGIITRIGDLVLDGSIRTQLMNMKESLKRGESA